MRVSSRSFISPRDLAAAVDVSESSLKRWADDGRIEMQKTAGGHRRIPIGAAIRFVRERGLPLVDPMRLGLPDLGAQKPGRQCPSGDELVRLFDEHQGGEAARTLMRAFLSGVPVADLCDGPIRDALESVGKRFETHADGIATEHAAVDACLQALGSIRGLLSPPSVEPLAIGGAVAGDPYLLPTLAVATVVEEEGGRAINVGPDAPATALAPLVAARKPSVVWRSASIVLEGEQLASELEVLAEIARDAEVIVGVGGRGFHQVGTLPDGVRSFDTLRQLSGFLRAAWSDEPQRDS